MRLLLACTLLAVLAGCSAPPSAIPPAQPQAIQLAPLPEPPEPPAVRDEPTREKLKQESRELLTKLRDISSKAGEAERYEDHAVVKAQAEAALDTLGHARKLGDQWGELHKRSQLHSDEYYGEYTTHVAAALTFLHAMLSERKREYADDCVRCIESAQHTWEKADYWERKEVANGKHPSIPGADD